MKHNADPIKAMMRSKSGNMTAMINITSAVTIRMPKRNKPREKPERPTRLGELATARASSPKAISKVLMIGRALRAEISMRRCSILLGNDRLER